MKISTKAEFFELWEAGVLGNRTRLWRDPRVAFLQAILLGIPEIGFRELGKTGGGAWEKVQTSDLPVTAVRWISLGRNFIMDDGAPADKQTIIGEICRTHRGLEGLIGFSQLPMRPSMAQGLLLPRTGATILGLLAKYMDPSSQDDLWAILDLFPDATIEFACFSVDVGIFPHRNTLFWEVRDY